MLPTPAITAYLHQTFDSSTKKIAEALINKAFIVKDKRKTEFLFEGIIAKNFSKSRKESGTQSREESKSSNKVQIMFYKVQN